MITVGLQRLAELALHGSILRHNLLVERAARGFVAALLEDLLLLDVGLELLYLIDVGVQGLAFVLQTLLVVKLLNWLLWRLGLLAAGSVA